MTGYLRRLWSGDVPLSLVFWRDMLVVGSVVNLGATGAMLALLALDAPTVAALAVHFAPLPLNVLLLSGVWHSAGSEPPAAAWPIRAIALVWFVAFIVI